MLSNNVQTVKLARRGSRSRSKTAEDMRGLSGFAAKFERFEQFERFGPLKNLLFLAVVFERFFRQDLSGFQAVFERCYKKTD